MNRYSIPQHLLNDPEVAAMHRELLLHEIDSTLSLAEARCMPFDEMLIKIENLPEQSNYREITFHACEYKLSQNQGFSLGEAVRVLAERVDELPSKKKAAYDRAVKRMLSRLPAEVAWSVAAPWLEHKRKFRREIAYSALRKTGVDENAGVQLLDIYDRTGDQSALELIARNPEATRNIEVESAIRLFEDQYWRMRMVEAVLIDEASRAISIKYSYPREFTQAVGRQKAKELLPELRLLLEKNAEDLSFLSIYAWALGQLKAMNDLNQLRIHVGKLS